MGSKMTTYTQSMYWNGIYTLWLILILALYVLEIIGLWKMFEKGGEEGWKAIIPIYNLYIAYKLFWGEGWLFLLMLVPCVNVIMLIILRWKTALSFNGDIGYFLGLLFIPEIMFIVLGFGSAHYIGPSGNGSYIQ